MIKESVKIFLESDGDPDHHQSLIILTFFVEISSKCVLFELFYRQTNGQTHEAKIHNRLS